MASIFMAGIYHGGTDKELFFLCGSVPLIAKKLILRRVRPFLVPVPEQKLAVAFGVAIVTQDGQSIGKCSQKLFPVALLYLLSFAARVGHGFPIVDRPRHCNAQLLLEVWILSPCQQSLYAFGF